VEPASLIWPQVLITCTVLNTLHAEEEESDGRMSRLKFFFILFGAGFAYYFLPGFLFTALSFFSWICWIKPNNIVVNQLFGTASGLGMSILTFDWSQINWLGSPLVTPWWAEVNIGVGFVLSMWVVVPAMYYSNVSLLPALDSGCIRFNLTSLCLSSCSCGRSSTSPSSPRPRLIGSGCRTTTRAS
jgi:hypothetical protein